MLNKHQNHHHHSTIIRIRLHTHKNINNNYVGYKLTSKKESDSSFLGKKTNLIGLLCVRVCVYMRIESYSQPETHLPYRCSSSNDPVPHCCLYHGHSETVVRRADRYCLVPVSYSRMLQTTAGEAPFTANSMLALGTLWCAMTYSSSWLSMKYFGRD